MNDQNVILQKEKGIAAITLNRPEKLNAFNGAMLEEIAATFEEAAADNMMKAITITGAGRAFCSGADLSSTDFQFNSASDNLRHLQKVTSLILRIKNAPQPVIAAVNGFAVGGGCNLALACDIIIASEKAKFIEPYVMRGIHPDWGATYFLPRLIGPAKAADILLTGRTIDAYEADRMGMISRVVPADQLENTTRDLAMAFSEGPPLAIRMAKASMNQALTMDLSAALEAEARAVTILNMTEDRNEGIAAFLQKRKPVFKGR